MKRSTVVVLSAVFVLAVAACGGSSSSKSSASSSSPTTLATTTTSAPATTGASSASTLGVATNSKIGQAILVNGSGNTVYLFEPDGTSTSSKVPAGIKANWPAVTGAATVGAGLDQTKVAVQMQPDGTSQVMYNGHLLYTFVGDTKPGDAAGQGLGGIWFVLSSAGEKIA
jgi:predicted lipoprotein with Yx(FWY)xxD motif